MVHSPRGYDAAGEWHRSYRVEKQSIESAEDALAFLRDAMLVLRFETRLLLVNLGDAIELDPVDEPLLAGNWTPAWSSGAPMTKLWQVPGHAAIVFACATPASADR